MPVNTHLESGPSDLAISDLKQSIRSKSDAAEPPVQDGLTVHGSAHQNQPKGILEMWKIQYWPSLVLAIISSRLG